MWAHAKPQSRKADGQGCVKVKKEDTDSTDCMDSHGWWRNRCGMDQANRSDPHPRCGRCRGPGHKVEAEAYDFLKATTQSTPNMRKMVERGSDAFRGVHCTLVNKALRLSGYLAPP